MSSTFSTSELQNLIKCTSLLLAEEIVVEMVMDCPNKRKGCESTFKLKEMAIHYNFDCAFEAHNFCPDIFGTKTFTHVMKNRWNFLTTTCTALRRADIVPHLKADHELTGVLDGRFSLDLSDSIVKTTGLSGWSFKFNKAPIYMKFDGKVFILINKWKFVRGCLCWRLVLLGSSVMAKKYRVKFTFRLGSLDETDPKSKIQWQGFAFGIDDLRHGSANWKNSANRFELPWSTFKTHKKEYEANGLVWKLDVEIIHTAKAEPSNAGSSSSSDSDSDAELSSSDSN